MNGRSSTKVVLKLIDIFTITNRFIHRVIAVEFKLTKEKSKLSASSSQVIFSL